MNRREALTFIAAAAALPTKSGFALGQGRNLSDNLSASFFIPRQFGAVGDGKALDSPAVNAAIEACNKGVEELFILLRARIYVARWN